MSYIKPEEVDAPKVHWKLVAVLVDKGKSKCSYAIGTWDGKKQIAMRWNGYAGERVGSPQSRGYATWMMLDPDLYPAVREIVKKDNSRMESTLLDFFPELYFEGFIGSGI